MKNPFKFKPKQLPVATSASEKREAPKPLELSSQRQRDMEKNARKQIAEFGEHFNDPRTTVTLDKMTTSSDGSKKKRFTVSVKDNVKFQAVFVERDGRQQLEQIVGLRRTEKKPESQRQRRKK